MSGKITQLLIAKDSNSAMKNVNQIILEENKGVFGEGYCNPEESCSSTNELNVNNEVTLIEIEKIEAFNKEFNESLVPEDFRRNIVISNFDLNGLVDKEFQIGNVLLKGVRLCEPCDNLSEQLDSEGSLEGVMEKSGLRAEVIRGGSIDLYAQVEI